MNQLSIVVASCDKFQDTWQPFIICFRKYYPECPYPVILVTESEWDSDVVKGYDKVIGCGNLEWSGRLIKALQQIESSHIFLLLDDFWFTDSMNISAFSEDVNKILSDSNIGGIYLNYVKWRFLKKYNDDYLEWPNGTIYRTNTRPAIWKKDFLVSVMRGQESVWQFERESPARAKEIPDKILCRKNQYLKFIYAVTAGKYEHNAIIVSKREGFELSNQRERRSRLDDFKLYIRSKVFDICPEFFTWLVKKLGR